jgi:tetratricopeptide (TPR) repeat protein
LLVTGFFFLGGQGFAILARKGDPELSIRTDSATPPVLSPRLSRARFWTPLDHRPHLQLGEARLADGDYEGALPGFVAGLRLNPVNGPTLYRLGRLLAGRGRMEDGAALMESGMRFSPLDLDMRRDNVLWLLGNQKFEQALAGVKGILYLAPEQTLFWLEYLSREGVTDRQLRTALPPHSTAYLQYGELRLKEEQPLRAEWGFRQAVDVARQTPHPEADAFLRLTYFLVEQGRIDEALSAARTGLERVPGSLDLSLLAGGLYERSGLTFRARELYHDALLLHPENQEVLMRLQRLGE